MGKVVFNVNGRSACPSQKSLLALPGEPVENELAAGGGEFFHESCLQQRFQVLHYGRLAFPELHRQVGWYLVSRLKLLEYACARLVFKQPFCLRVKLNSCLALVQQEVSRYYDCYECSHKRKQLLERYSLLQRGGGCCLLACLSLR